MLNIDLYGQDAIRTLRFARRAQSLRMTLKEIRQLLELTQHRRRPCKAISELAHQHLIELNEKIRQLQSTRGEVRYLLPRRMAVRRNEVRLYFRPRQTGALSRSDPGKCRQLAESSPFFGKINGNSQKHCLSHVI
jgi:DNA-binding transcriptional MerR regulator